MDRSEVLWGSMPGLCYAFLIYTVITLFQPQGVLPTSVLVLSVFVAVDLLRFIGWKVVRKYLGIVVVVIVLYSVVEFSFVRWGALGLILVVLGLALFRILRNRKGYLAAVKSFDKYLVKWDPKWGKKQ